MDARVVGNLIPGHAERHLINLRRARTRAPTHHVVSENVYKCAVCARAPLAQMSGARIEPLCAHVPRGGGRTSHCLLARVRIMGHDLYGECRS